MGRNIVKVLEKKFADMKAGDRMYISSPEEIKSFIINIPRGTSKSLKSHDEKWIELKKEIDEINQFNIPEYNNELWSNGIIGALN